MIFPRLMPKKNDKKSSRKSGSRGTSGSSVVAVPTYRGPVKIPGRDNQTLVYKTNQVYSTASNTSAGGVYDLVFGNSPAVLSNWTALSAEWNEYRVLGLELVYEPIKNVSAWAYGTANTVVDHDVSSALGGVNAATQHESFMEFSMFRRWSRKARACGVEEMDFIVTTSPSATFYIKVYSDGNATIQTIGRFYLYYLIEFRGKN